MLSVVGWAADITPYKPDSFSNVKKMEPLIDTRIQDWIEKLNERFAEGQKKMDFAPWAVFVAYDIISEVGFGEWVLRMWAESRSAWGPRISPPRRQENTLGLCIYRC